MTTVIKMLWSFFIFVWVADGAAFASDAREDCSRCHTTQLPIEEGGFIDKDANYCVRCHGTKTEVNNGRSDSMPFVYHATSTDLAGGNFYYVALKGNRYGHNVAGFTDIGPDTISPPGLNDPSLDFHTTRLTCAGRYGCHGDRTRVSPYEAMKGVHHAYDPAKSSDGKTIATSYRFLLEVTGQEMNEEGYKWECTVNPGKHNGYQGADGWNDPKSISYFCGRCHGNDTLGCSTSNFHGAAGTGGASPWLRHPTDIIIPEGEFSGYTTYNPTVPMARLDLKAVADPAKVDVSTGNEVVMCLSCHRAHGSPYSSILRFAYGDNMSPLGSCRTCHTRH